MAKAFRGFLSSVTPEYIKRATWIVRFPAMCLQERVVIRSAGRVISGLFQGMNYISGSVGSTFYPKVLGTYELELAPILRSLPELAIDELIDIGAAEGYYAVGLVWNGCVKNAIAFEMDQSGRKMIVELARGNGVFDKVDVRSRCEPSDLVSVIHPKKRQMILCDVEGYETELFNREVLPFLSNAAVLMETHDCFVAGICDQLAARFSHTHDVNRIASKPRRQRDFPRLGGGAPLVAERYKVALMSELRAGPMEWIWAVPKSWK